jgi:hypothetical protein
VKDHIAEKFNSYAGKIVEKEELRQAITRITREQDSSIMGQFKRLFNDPANRVNEFTFVLTMEALGNKDPDSPALVYESRGSHDRKTFLDAKAVMDILVKNNWPEEIQTLFSKAIEKIPDHREKIASEEITRVFRPGPR